MVWVFLVQVIITGVGFYVPLCFTSPNYWGDFISNRYGKVIFKIPKKGHLPTPVGSGFSEKITDLLGWFLTFLALWAGWCRILKLVMGVSSSENGGTPSHPFRTMRSSLTKTVQRTWGYPHKNHHLTTQLWGDTGKYMGVSWNGGTPK